MMDVSYKQTTSAKLATIGKVHGQMIFVTDDDENLNDIYADFLDKTTNTVVRHKFTRSPAFYYGVCSDEEDVVNKTVTISNFKLANGAWAFVKFTNGNTAEDITLNINSTGAKAVKYVAITPEDHIIAGVPYQVVYNGTNYERVNIFDFSPDLSMSVNLNNGHLYYDFSVT